MSTSRERVSKARRDLVLDQPFFGVLSLKLELVESRRFKTLATDGKTLWFNPDYVSELSDHELKGVVAHEVLHCANGHTWRRESRDPKVWNDACDYAINQIVIDAGMLLPSGALLDPAYNGMSAEEVYDRLMQHAQPEQPGAGDSCNDQRQDDGEGNGDGSSGGVSCGEVVDSQDMPETKADWQASVLNAAKLAKGSLPADLERLVEEIRNPPQDWKAILRRSVQMSARQDYSWRMPNNRYLHMGLYLPTLASEAMPSVVVAIDTSGSIDNVMLGKFTAEVSAIMEDVKPEMVYVIQCDADIQTVEEYEPGEPIRLNLKGGGGTDFRPVFEWVDRQGLMPACLIYLTDLAGDYPDRAPDYPVLWAATDDWSPPWGEVVRIR
jgi:predicted metal-dependent peptidase